MQSAPRKRKRKGVVLQEQPELSAFSASIAQPYYYGAPGPHGDALFTTTPCVLHRVQSGGSNPLHQIPTVVETGPPIMSIGQPILSMYQPPLKRPIPTIVTDNVDLPLPDIYNQPFPVHDPCPSEHTFSSANFFKPVQPDGAGTALVHQRIRLPDHLGNTADASVAIPATVSDIKTSFNAPISNEPTLTAPKNSAPHFLGPTFYDNRPAFQHVQPPRFRSNKRSENQPREPHREFCSSFSSNSPSPPKSKTIRAVKPLAVSVAYPGASPSFSAPLKTEVFQKSNAAAPTGSDTDAPLPVFCKIVSDLVSENRGEKLQHAGASNDIEVLAAPNKLSDARHDPVLYDPETEQSNGVLEIMLRKQMRYLPSSTPVCYFEYSEKSSDIRHWMRETVAQWMYDVCDELKREIEVFSLATMLMDRYLSTMYGVMKRETLQLLGAACMLIASKLKETHPLMKSTLVRYSAQSFREDQLDNMEFAVLTELKWDVHGITAIDFMDHLLQRLDKVMDTQISRHRNKIKDTINKCYVFPQFLRTAPSILCSAAILYDLAKLRQQSNIQPLYEMDTDSTSSSIHSSPTASTSTKTTPIQRQLSDHTRAILSNITSKMCPARPAKRRRTRKSTKHLRISEHEEPVLTVLADFTESEPNAIRMAFLQIHTKIFNRKMTPQRSSLDVDQGELTETAGGPSRYVGGQDSVGGSLNTSPDLDQMEEICGPINSGVP